MNAALKLILSGLAISSLLPSAAAQNPSRIFGIVYDPSDAVVAGAKITLTTKDGPPSQTVSDNKGEFLFDVRPVGRYDLTAEASGFKQETIHLNSRDSTSRVRLVLSIADVRETVNVDPGDFRTNVNPQGNLNVIRLDASQLEGLPVFNGDVISALVPLLAQGSMGAGGPTIIVDGLPATNVHLNLSEIQEVRINNNPYSAEYARPGRSRIEITTKSGSAKYHGSLGFALRDYVLDARNYFAASKPPENRMQFDASLSGPVWKGDKDTFSFTSNGSRDKIEPVVYATGLNGPIQSNANETQNGRYVSAQYTHKIDNNTMSFRYSRFGWSDAGQGAGGFVLPEAAADSKSSDHQLYASDQAILGPQLVNDFFVRVHREESATGSLLPGVPKLIVNGAFTSGGSQAEYSSTESGLQLTDNLSWSHGRHTFRTGFNVPSFARLGQDVRANFDGTYSFSSLADYAAGRAYLFERQAGDGHIAFWQKQAAGYVQDEFRVRPNFSVAGGVRYEWQNYGAGYHNFAPRFSFAYGLDKQAKTVVRGGAGMFYDSLPTAAIADTMLLNGSHLESFQILNLNYFAATPGLLTGVAPNIARFGPALKSPYLFQYSLTVERQLRKSLTWTTTLTDMRGIDLYRSRDVNAPLPPLYAVRPLNSIGVLRALESSGGSKSQELQTTLRGDLTRFFKGMVMYQIGHAHDDTDGVNSMPANNWNLQGEWARSSLDVRHFVYLYGTVNAWKGIKFGAIFSASSGKPYTMTTGLDSYNTGIANARPAGVERNTLQGSGSATLDLHWSRDFSIRRVDLKGLRLNAGADIFNVLNRTNYTSYVGNLSSPFYGTPVAAAAARRTQLALSVRF